MKKLKISIIIPVLNEEKTLQRNLPRIQEMMRSNKEHEILVVDGGSSDNTIREVQNKNARLIHAKKAQRTHQMNLGAKEAKGEVLYFLHADAVPPNNFDVTIESSLKSGNHFGLFAYRFEPTNFWLNLNAYFTQFEGLFSGGGDQSLFIRSSAFSYLGGFNENMPLMEDFDFFTRAEKEFEYAILPDRITVSSRKYNGNSYLKLQLINMYVFFSYKMGRDLDLLARQYKNWLG